VASRPKWDDRHHLVFSRENGNHPMGQRDFFDRPRELRLKVEGEDGISKPYENRPSLHWLKYQESPKMNRSVGNMSRSSLGGGPSEHSPKSNGTSHKGAPFDFPSESEMDSIWNSIEPEKLIGVGSPAGSPMKPMFQKTGSWLLEPEVLPSSEKRKIKFTSTHYSEKHGTMHDNRSGKQVEWNNRWHLTPSRFGKLHPAYQEYFDNPSRLYTSSTEDWRCMYGDNCEEWAIRAPGMPLKAGGYGWKGMKKSVEVLKSPR
jgi:hypothetical protein